MEVGGGARRIRAGASPIRLVMHVRLKEEGGDGGSENGGRDQWERSTKGEQQPYDRERG